MARKKWGKFFDYFYYFLLSYVNKFLFWDALWKKIEKILKSFKNIKRK